MPTVLVVDDHAAFRTSVRALLEADGFSVIGEVGTGIEAIAAAGDLCPDLVLLDIRLPDLDGISVADALAVLPTPPDVVLVSSRDRAVYGARLAYRDSAAKLQAAFERPGVLERSYRSPLGVTTGAERLQIRLYDLLAHGWDLARPQGNPSSCLTMWPISRWNSCAGN